MSSKEKRSFDSIFENAITDIKHESLTQEDVTLLIRKHKTEQKRKNAKRKFFDIVLATSILLLLPTIYQSGLSQGIMATIVLAFTTVHIVLYSRFHKKLEQQDKSTTYQEYLDLRKKIIERGLKELQTFRACSYYISLPVFISVNLMIGYQDFGLKQMSFLVVFLAVVSAWIIYELETGIKESKLQLKALE